MGSVIGWWTESFSTVISRARALSTAMVLEQPYSANVATRMPVLTASIAGQHPYSSSVASVMKKMSTSVAGVEIPQAQVGSLIVKPTTAVTVSQSQAAMVTAVMKALSSNSVVAESNPVAVASLLKLMASSATGAQAQSGTVAAVLKTVLTQIATFSATAQVTYDALGTGTAEASTSPMTCSITPTAGDDVFAFVPMGAAGRSLVATYGASNLKMQLLGRVTFATGASVTVYRIHNVASGAATVSVTRSGSAWGQVQAVAYKNVVGVRIPKVMTGVGTALSHSVATPPANGRTAQAFGTGDVSLPLSSLSGGTNRYSDNAGFVAESIGDTAASATFAATIASSNPWGSIAIPMGTAAISGPQINDINWSSAENVGANTFDLVCAVGDYVFVDLYESGNVTPSVITCAGTTMTLVDSQVFNSSYSLRRYRIGPLATAGTKTINSSAAGIWSRIAGVSVSGMSGVGTTTKTSGAASQPSHAVTLSANQIALQSFGMDSSAVSTVAGANVFDNPSGASAFGYMALADETTTFALGNTSANWGSMITVLS